ncbi:MAG: site-specific integrase [Desulfobacteraceae bacterium]|nr:site-specific integrase [Desulfobacteraceae bacterium]
MSQWTKAAPGVRYREHPTRKSSGRPDRYWVIYFRRDGSYIQEGLGWSTEGWNLAKAQAKLLEFKINARTGDGPVSSKEKRTIRDRERKVELAKQEEERLATEREKLENVSFGDLIESYVKWVKSNKKSQRMDESRCRVHISPALGHLRARDIDVAVLSGFKEELVAKSASFTEKKTYPKRRTHKGQPERGPSKTLSEATIRHCMVLIRQIFNHSIAMGYFIGKNPIAKGNIPKSLKERLVPNRIDNERTRFLSPPEADSLLRELKERSLQTHDIALIALRTGARFSEIVSLEWQHIDFFNNRIHIKGGKNGRSRVVFMTPDVNGALLARNNGKPDELVFKSTKGGKIAQISAAFRRAVHKLKFNEGITDQAQEVVFHTLRHTFGSWLAQQGTSLYVIKELMGHEKIEMTMRYAHLLPDTKLEAVMQMFQECASGKVIRMVDHIQR